MAKGFTVKAKNPKPKKATVPEFDYAKAKEMKNITFMKKYTDSKVPINIDPISNEYKITIPEWVVNEFDWYEDTELVWVVDDQGIHIQEVSE